MLTLKHPSAAKPANQLGFLIFLSLTMGLATGTTSVLGKAVLDFSERPQFK
jgi:hypothetical protein